MHVQKPNKLSQSRYSVKYNKRVWFILANCKALGQKRETSSIQIYPLDSLLVERPNPKPKQPRKYILAVLPSGRREYVSGILDTNKIDYQGRYFVFQMEKANEFSIQSTFAL
jgi:hypothetical protein